MFVKMQTILSWFKGVDIWEEIELLVTILFAYKSS